MKTELAETSKIAMGGKIYHSDITNFYVSRMKKHKKLTLSQMDSKRLAKPGNWLMLCEYEGQPLRPDDFQMGPLNSRAVLNFGIKGRQMGWSLMCVSGRATCRSHQYKDWNSIIVSYNLTEAKQKIKMARIISEGVPSKIRQKVKGESSLYLKYANGSEIHSLFSPRGHNNSDIYLDEFSYCADQYQIYKDAFPIVERQINKQLFIGGTPFGKAGMFWDLHNPPEGKFQNFNRFIWFWWDSDFYCKNVSFARHGDPINNILPAHMLTTEERVYVYGTPVLVEIYENMLKEDFQQEYEACFQDERTSFFPYDLIVKRMGWFSFEYQQEFPETLEDIAAWNQGVLFAGYDVGRRRNTSELYVFDYRNYEKNGMKKPKLIQIFQKTLDKTDFDTQEQFLKNFLTMYQDRIGVFQIDQNQIGEHLTERLTKAFPHSVRGVALTNPSKNRMATATKIFMTNGILELWPDKETIAHVHSIKQMITPFGNVRFDAERNLKHHADRFWAIALAVDGANDEENLGVLPEIYRC